MRDMDLMIVIGGSVTMIFGALVAVAAGVACLVFVARGLWVGGFGRDLHEFLTCLICGIVCAAGCYLGAAIAVAGRAALVTL